MKCFSGIHEWTEKIDAERCCHPHWIRCVGVRMHGNLAVYSHFWLHHEWLSSPKVRKLNTEDVLKHDLVRAALLQLKEDGSAVEKPVIPQTPNPGRKAK